MRFDLKKKLCRISSRRSLQFTRLGKQIVAMTIAIGVVAINTGHNLFYLIVAMLLSLILLSGILSEQSLRLLRVKRVLPTGPFAGTSAHIQFRVRNPRRRLASFCVQIREFDYPEVKTPILYRLAAGEQRLLASPISLPRRGRYSFHKIRIETTFPFGFFRKSVIRDHAEELIVYPKPLTLSPDIIRGVPTLGQARNRSFLRSNEPGTIKSLRNYQEGEDARAIHWKATARQTRTLLKEYEHEEEQQIVVYLANHLPCPRSEADLESFERAVTLAASLVSLFLTSGFYVGLKAGTEEIPIGKGPVHLANMLQVLALIAPDGLPHTVSLSRLPPYPKVLVLPVADPFWDTMKSGFSKIFQINDPELAPLFASAVMKEGEHDH